MFLSTVKDPINQTRVLIVTHTGALPSMQALLARGILGADMAAAVSLRVETADTYAMKLPEDFDLGFYPKEKPKEPWRRGRPVR